jgi:O-phosphoseryl-tRNA(Cys) synthetase
MNSCPVNTVAIPPTSVLAIWAAEVLAQAMEVAAAAWVVVEEEEALAVACNEAAVMAEIVAETTPVEASLVETVAEEICKRDKKSDLRVDIQYAVVSLFLRFNFNVKMEFASIKDENKFGKHKISFLSFSAFN